MPASEQVPLNGSVTPKPTVVEWWAFWLLLVIGVSVLGISLYGAYDHFVNIGPRLPPLDGRSLPEVQESVNRHKLIAEEARAPFLAMFDLIVSRTLLPLVTLLMGYLFGKAKQ